MCAPKASIWSAPKCRCASKPTAGSPCSPAPTSGRSPPPRTKLPAAQPGQAAGTAPPGPLRGASQDIAGVLAWIDGLGATGLDGHDLRELGLKNGNLIVDDQRNGKHWTFSRINVSLTRPEQGGVIFRLASDEPARPWVLSAAMRPLGDGVRAVGIEARHVSIQGHSAGHAPQRRRSRHRLAAVGERARGNVVRRHAAAGCRARCSRMPAPSPITAPTLSM